MNWTIQILQEFCSYGYGIGLRQPCAAFQHGSLNNCTDRDMSVTTTPKKNRWISHKLKCRSYHGFSEVTHWILISVSPDFGLQNHIADKQDAEHTTAHSQASQM